MTHSDPTSKFATGSQHSSNSPHSSKYSEQSPQSEPLPRFNTSPEPIPFNQQVFSEDDAIEAVNDLIDKLVDNAISISESKPKTLVLDKKNDRMRPK